jgi:phosphatidylglycerol:prolipoprotein diacylglycerol transferase
MSDASGHIEHAAVGRVEGQPASAERLRRMIEQELERLLEQPPAPRGVFGALNGALDGFASRSVQLRLGSWIVSGYGVFVSLGFGLGIFSWLHLLDYRVHYPLPPVLLILGVVPTAFAGSRLLFVLERALASSLEQSRVAARGHTLYGAIVSVLLFLGFLSRENSAGLLFYLDCGAPSFALGYAIGKIGCLSGGCCVGRVTRSRLAVTYTAALSKAVVHYRLKGVRLLPIQLYEAAFGLALFLLLSLQPTTAFGTGQIFGWFLLLFGVGRQILLWFRYRFPGERAGPLLTGTSNLAYLALGTLCASGLAHAGLAAPAAYDALSPDPSSLLVLIGTSGAVAALALYLFGIRRVEVDNT